MPTLKVKYKQDEFYLDQSGQRKYYDAKARENVIQYIFRPDKTPHGLIGGWAVDPMYAASQMNYLSKAYGKEDGLQLRHFILSFSEKEVQRMGQCALIRIDEYAQYAALYYGGEYQIVYAVHEDSRHLHVHFVLNTLNYRTGKKYPGDKEDLETLQDMYHGGADLSRIAIELSRAEHGIVAKLLEMGLLIPEHAKRNRSARKKKEGKCAGCPYQCPRKKCLKEE